jgi:mannose-6-phosphate isomerase-like protein (cupin superfamily)
MSQGSTLEPKWRWTVAEARRAPLEPGRASPSLFRRGTMNLRWYAPRGRDDQTPHEQDEIYFVESGSGRFLADGQGTAFGPGDVLFVPAGAAHRFEDFSDDLAAWAVFWGPAGGEES